MLKKLIVHIIPNDKFTSGYIDFMVRHFDEFDHFFAVELPVINSLNQSNVHYTENIYDFTTDKVLLHNLYSSYKIIVSGLFHCVDGLLHLESNILSKAYLQFWGSDFYCFNSNDFWIRKNKIKFLCDKQKLCTLVQKVGGIINLIPEDYTELCQILNVKPRSHFVAPMVGNPLEKVDYEKLKNNYFSSNSVRVIVGNSATKTNHHIEVLKKLVHLKDNIQVYCPLSYGDSKYAQKVINAEKNC